MIALVRLLFAMLVSPFKWSCRDAAALYLMLMPKRPKAQLPAVRWHLAFFEKDILNRLCHRG